MYVDVYRKCKSSMPCGLKNNILAYVHASDAFSWGYITHMSHVVRLLYSVRRKLYETYDAHTCGLPCPLIIFQLPS